MRFVLHYRGPLKANGGPDHKHQIRLKFHQQLARLWQEEPLKGHQNLLNPEPVEGRYHLRRTVGGHVFTPLVTDEMRAVAGLKVTLLRTGAPGAILTHGGDIDNCLKTLFDALTMPPHPNALPKNLAPPSEDEPFLHCLLEDDKLVTSVQVVTEQLLEDAAKDEVELIVVVDVSVRARTIGNALF